MRRLTLVPCTASWESMPADGDGRFCERCDLRVTDVATLDDAGVDALLERAASGKACARFELVGGRPRIRHGLAAGLLVAVTLSGCIAPDSNVWGIEEAELVEPNLGKPRGRVISGVLYDNHRFAVPDTLVILQGAALSRPREATTDLHGRYSFSGLPPGTYAIQTFSDRAARNRIVSTTPGARVEDLDSWPMGAMAIEE